MPPRDPSPSRLLGARAAAAARNAWAWLESEEAPGKPFYDPVHLGGVLVLTMTAAGGLYWLLWTLLVYEGGLFLKLKAALDILLTPRTLADYGCRAGPGELGVFEGWLGNAAALALTALAVAWIHRLSRDAARGS